MGELSIWHWLLVGAVAMMLFGANRLPDVARSVGRSMRILRSELRGIENDGETRVVDGTTQPAGAAAGPAPAAAAGSAGAAAGSAGAAAGSAGAESGGLGREEPGGARQPRAD